MDWQPISTAPKDGTLIDVWLVNAGWGEGRGDRQYREVDVRWHNGQWVDAEFLGIEGEVHCPDGRHGVAAATHWVKPPSHPVI